MSVRKLLCVLCLTFATFSLVAAVKEKDIIVPATGGLLIVGPETLSYGQAGEYRCYLCDGEGKENILVAPEKWGISDDSRVKLDRKTGTIVYDSLWSAAGEAVLTATYQGINASLTVMLEGRDPALFPFDWEISDGEAKLVRAGGDYYYENKAVLEIPSFVDGVPVTAIGDRVFYEMNLRGVVIPEGVVSIGAGAFRYCYADAVVLPSTLRHIDGGAFVSGPSAIEISPNNPYMKVDGNFIVSKDGKTLLLLVDGHDADYFGDCHIPAGTVAISDEAFKSICLASNYYCEKICIPASVSTMTGTGLAYVERGSDVLDGSADCHSCTYEIDAANPYFKEENGLLLSADGKTLVYVKNDRDSTSAFALPDGVERIGEGAFAGLYLDDIVLPDGCTVIPANAFRGVGFNREELQIPEGVVEIGEDAFRNTSVVAIRLPQSLRKIGDRAFKCTHANTIEIPMGVESIGDEAFANSHLEKVAFPDSVKEMGNAVFADCYYNLYEVVLPAGLKRIGNKFFYDCEGLSSLSLPDSLVEIGERAFCWCGLSSIELPAGVRRLGRYAFCRTGLASIELPEGIEELPDGLFWECYSLSTVTLPHSLKKIGFEVFCYCDELTEMTIPEGVTAIGGRAFYESSLKNVTLPNSVKIIGEDAFNTYGLESLRLPAGVESVCMPLGVDKVTVAEENPNFMVNANALMSRDGLRLMQYLGDGKSYQVPAGVRVIGRNAFEYCSSLASVHIPGTLKRVEDEAFYWCTNLVNLQLDEGIESIGTSAFEYCSSLASVHIPGTVKRVEDDAFHGCTNLVNLQLDEGIESIGTSAFEYCSSLASVHIPGTVKRVEDYAFYGCTNLVTLQLDEGIESIGAYAFGTCFLMDEAEVAGTVAIPASVRRIEEGAFYNCENLKQVSFSDGLEEIGDEAFCGSGIIELTLPETLGSLGEEAFSCCFLLERATLGGALEVVPEWAFYACYNLKEVTFREGVRQIGFDVFGSCDSMTNVKLPGSLEVLTGWGLRGEVSEGLTIELAEDNPFLSWDGYAFFSKDGKHLLEYVGQYGKSEYAIPAGVECIDAYAFVNCQTLKKVHIGEDVREIGEEAFRSCSLEVLDGGLNLVTIGDYAFLDSELREITIGDKVQEIGEKCFGFDARNLSRIYFLGMRGEVSDMLEKSVYIVVISRDGYEDMVYSVAPDARLVVAPDSGWEDGDSWNGNPVEFLDPFGLPNEGWMLMTVPFQLSASSWAELASSGRFFAYDEANEAYVMAKEVAPKKAYWFYGTGKPEDELFIYGFPIESKNDVEPKSDKWTLVPINSLFEVPLQPEQENEWRIFEWFGEVWLERPPVIPLFPGSGYWVKKK